MGTTGPGHGDRLQTSYLPSEKGQKHGEGLSQGPGDQGLNPTASTGCGGHPANYFMSLSLTPERDTAEGRSLCKFLSGCINAGGVIYRNLCLPQGSTGGLILLIAK